MTDRTRNLLFISAGCLIAGLVLVIAITGISTGLGKAKTQDLANELKNKGLYVQAIDEYKEFLSSGLISKSMRSAVCYTIAETYNNEMRDLDNALAWYLKAKYFNPRASFMPELNSRIIACLESSGRNVEARGELSSMTAMDKSKVVDKNAVIVAKVGGDAVTLKDFERWFETLPASLRNQFPGLDGKRTMLRQYVAQEVLFQSALRRGFDKDPRILEEAFDAKKGLMVQKVLQEEVMKNARIDDSDLRNYYQAHLKDFYDTRRSVQLPFEQVRNEVSQAVFAEKAQNLSQEYINRLISTSDVRIIDENIK